MSVTYVHKPAHSDRTFTYNWGKWGLNMALPDLGMSVSLEKIGNLGVSPEEEGGKRAEWLGRKLGYSWM